MTDLSTARSTLTPSNTPRSNGKSISLEAIYSQRRGLLVIEERAFIHALKMISRAALLFLFAANILIPIAILTFATGFFPYKPFLSGLAEVEDLSEYGCASSLPDPPFDKVIFMVVDALRR